MGYDQESLHGWSGFVQGFKARAGGTPAPEGNSPVIHPMIPNSTVDLSHPKASSILNYVIGGSSSL
jgi:hypothetical protein